MWLQGRFRLAVSVKPEVKSMKRTALSLVLGLSLLAACNTTTNPGTDTQVALTGLVGGSSSNLTLNGASLDLSGATVTENGEASSRGSVQPGAEIEGNGRKNGGRIKIDTVELRYRVRGQLDAVDVNGKALEVVGVKATVNDNTRIVEKLGDGHYSPITLNDLKVGDLLKVSGLPQPDDSVIATRIERRSRAVAALEAGKSEPSGSEDPNRVELFVQARKLSATDKIFTYGLQTHSVDYTKAEVRGKLDEGTFVRVRGVRLDPAPAPASLNPNAINVTRVVMASRVIGFQIPGQQPGVRVELRGAIGDLNETAKTFVMYGFTVDYASAEVRGTLKNGAKAEVEGTLDTTDVRLVRAKEVKVKKAEDKDD
jgi:predicted small secreted protein